ncbi:MAG: VWA domain-containing protein [Chthoniobacterales bacterium]|nr:VWA domain-containing protein [Chthoniobacterales bacterium]
MHFSQGILTTPHGDFSFVHPWVLFGLLGLPLLAWLRGRFGGSPGVLFSSTSLVLKLGQPRRARSGSLLAALIYGAMALFIIALARPQLGQTLQHIKASGIDIMLVLDVSGSMSTEDYTIGNQPASRLEAVKRVTEQFIEGRPNDRIGIIAFAGRPYLVSPITLDHEWLIQNLDRVQLGLVEDGTAIGSALAAAAARLKKSTAKTKLIVLLTDGSNNAGKVMPLTAAEATQALGIRIYTVGAGSNGPVSVPVKDQFGRVFYKQVIFDFDEKLLQDIATIGKGRYFRAADSTSLDKTFKEIDKLEKSKIEIEKNVNNQDFFWWFVALGTLLLLAEMVLSQSYFRKIP